MYSHPGRTPAMNFLTSSICGPVIWLLLTLVLVLTPAPSTLPYGTNVQNNCGWISLSVETLRPKTISVGAALVCRLWLWWFALGFDSSMKFAPMHIPCRDPPIGICGGIP